MADEHAASYPRPRLTHPQDSCDTSNNSHVSRNRAFSVDEYTLASNIFDSTRHGPSVAAGVAGSVSNGKAKAGGGTATSKPAAAPSPPHRDTRILSSPQPLPHRQRSAMPHIFTTADASLSNLKSKTLGGDVNTVVPSGGDQQRHARRRRSPDVVDEEAYGTFTPVQVDVTASRRGGEEEEEEEDRREMSRTRPPPLFPHAGSSDAEDDRDAAVLPHIDSNTSCRHNHQEQSSEPVTRHGGRIDSAAARVVPPLPPPPPPPAPHFPVLSKPYASSALSTTYAPATVNEAAAALSLASTQNTNTMGLSVSSHTIALDTHTSAHSHHAGTNTTTPVATPRNNNNNNNNGTARKELTSAYDGGARAPLFYRVDQTMSSDGCIVRPRKVSEQSLSSKTLITPPHAVSSPDEKEEEEKEDEDDEGDAAEDVGGQIPRKPTQDASALTSADSASSDTTVTPMLPVPPNPRSSSSAAASPVKESREENSTETLQSSQQQQQQQSLSQEPPSITKRVLFKRDTGVALMLHTAAVPVTMTTKDSTTLTARLALRHDAPPDVKTPVTTTTTTTTTTTPTHPRSSPSAVSGQSSSMQPADTPAVPRPVAPAQEKVSDGGSSPTKAPHPSVETGFSLLDYMDSNELAMLYAASTSDGDFGPVVEAGGHVAAAATQISSLLPPVPSEPLLTNGGQGPRGRTSTSSAAAATPSAGVFAHRITSATTASAPRTPQATRSTLSMGMAGDNYYSFGGYSRLSSLPKPEAPVAKDAQAGAKGRPHSSRLLESGTSSMSTMGDLESNGSFVNFFNSFAQREGGTAPTASAGAPAKGAAAVLPVNNNAAKVSAATSGESESSAAPPQIERTTAQLDGEEEMDVLGHDYGHSCLPSFASSGGAARNANNGAQKPGLGKRAYLDSFFQYNRRSSSPMADMNDAETPHNAQTDPKNSNDNRNGNTNDGDNAFRKGDYGDESDSSHSGHAPMLLARAPYASLFEMPPTANAGTAAKTDDAKSQTSCDTTSTTTTKNARAKARGVPVTLINKEAAGLGDAPVVRPPTPEQQTLQKTSGKGRDDDDDAGDNVGGDDDYAHDAYSYASQMRLPDLVSPVAPATRSTTRKHPPRATSASIQQQQQQAQITVTAPLALTGSLYGDDGDDDDDADDDAYDERRGGVRNTMHEAASYADVVSFLGGRSRVSSAAPSRLSSAAWSRGDHDGVSLQGGYSSMLQLHFDEADSSSSLPQPQQQQHRGWRQTEGDVTVQNLDSDSYGAYAYSSGSSASNMAADENDNSESEAQSNDKSRSESLVTKEEKKEQKDAAQPAAAAGNTSNRNPSSQAKEDGAAAQRLMRADFNHSSPDGFNPQVQHVRPSMSSPTPGRHPRGGTNSASPENSLSRPSRADGQTSPMPYGHYRTHAHPARGGPPGMPVPVPSPYRSTGNTNATNSNGNSQNNNNNNNNGTRMTFNQFSPIYPNMRLSLDRVPPQQQQQQHPQRPDNSLSFGSAQQSFPFSSNGNQRRPPAGMPISLMGVESRSAMSPHPELSLFDHRDGGNKKKQRAGASLSVSDEHITSEMPSMNVVSVSDTKLPAQRPQPPPLPMPAAPRPADMDASLSGPKPPPPLQEAPEIQPYTRAYYGEAGPLEDPNAGTYPPMAGGARPHGWGQPAWVRQCNGAVNNGNNFLPYGPCGPIQPPPWPCAAVEYDRVRRCVGQRWFKFVALEIRWVPSPGLSPDERSLDVPGPESDTNNQHGDNSNGNSSPTSES